MRSAVNIGMNSNGIIHSKNPLANAIHWDPCHNNPHQSIISLGSFSGVYNAVKYSHLYKSWLPLQLLYDSARGNKRILSLYNLAKVWRFYISNILMFNFGIILNKLNKRMCVTCFKPLLLKIKITTEMTGKSPVCS